MTVKTHQVDDISYEKIVRKGCNEETDRRKMITNDKTNTNYY